VEAAHRGPAAERRPAGCDERGWDALPLAAKELCRLFLNLWATNRAAERWTAKNPLKAYRDTIRFWGVITEYRRSGGHGRWSMALVRHGADPGSALAGVLGVSAGDIRMRDCGE
jgi:hypothetical protein